MPAPWYEDYFTADYWTYADAEYTPERTEREVRYLSEALRGRRRVLDLGCGTGRHAIGLARLGFEVTGLDVSAYALRRAEQEAERAGVRLRLHRVDLLGSAVWGVPQADAVICVQAFGWGTDADQLRMLRTARRLLSPGGLLVLDHSPILAITRMYQQHAQARVGAAEFVFNREYEPGQRPQRRPGAGPACRRHVSSAAGTTSACTPAPRCGRCSSGPASS